MMLVMLWGSRYALAVVSAGYGGLVAVLAVGSPSAYVVGSLLALAEQERLYFTYRCAHGRTAAMICTTYPQRATYRVAYC